MMAKFIISPGKARRFVIASRVRMVATNTRHKVIVWAVACSIITYIDRVCIAQAKPHIVGELHLTDAQWGLVLSAFVWSYALFEVPTGWMGDVFGARKTLTRVVVWWSIFTAATAAAWSFLSLVVIRFLFGIGEAGCFPNITRAFTTWLPDRERVRAQGINWMCARWGGAFTPLLVGLILRWVDWRQAFIAFGALGIVWAVFFYRWFRDDPKDHPDVNAAELEVIRDGQAPDPGHPHLPVGKLMSSLSIWLLWLQYFAISYSWYFYITWLPDYMGVTLGLDPKQYGWLNGAPLFLGGLGCFVGGMVLAKLTKTMGSMKARRLVGQLGAVVAAACLIIAVQMKDPFLALFFLSFSSFGNDLTMPAAWGAAMNLGGRFAGSVSGSMNMMGNGGGGLFPITYPFLRSNFGIESVFYVNAAVYALSFLAWTLLDSSKAIDAE
ncbi:MAG: MFS transporter [Verrucomicrobiota bacterium]